MIEIKSKKNKFTYNVYHVTKAFFPEEEIVQTVDEEQEPLVWMQLPGGACFSLAERSLTMADRKAGSDPAGLSVSFRRMRQRTGMGNAHGSQTHEACDAEAGRRNGSGTDQEVP